MGELCGRRPLTASLVVLLIGFSGSAVAEPLAPQIHTVAGGGTCAGGVTSGGPCDGVVASSVPIGKARSVAALPDGGFLYIDAQNYLVREVSPSGTVTTVAGNGTTIDAPDGTLAVDSGLDDPVAIAPLAGGGFLVTEYAGSVVRMVGPGPPATATITTIAGTGVPGHAGGASGRATSIELNYPSDAVPTPSGAVLIADTYNNAIRLLSDVSPDAKMSTIAGGGSCQDATASCNGDAAAAVALDLPDSVSPTQSGGYLIAEYGASAVRAVTALSTAGIFSTVAGTPGTPGYGGDGGAATQAELSSPEDVVSTPDGGFLITDTVNEVIREVSSAGVISTVAGTPDGAGYSGDGAAATEASLNGPAAVSPLPDGNLLIADTSNDVIREITIPPVSSVTLDPAVPKGAGGWYVSSVNASVTASESAVDIRCELDPAAAPPAYGALPPSCPFSGSGGSISGDGTHTLYAASSNSFGDAENPVSATVRIDTTPPTLTCVGAPKVAFGSLATVTAKVADSVSGPSTPTVSAMIPSHRLGSGKVVLAGTDVAGLRTRAACPYTIVPAALTPVPTSDSRFAPARSYTTVERLSVDGVEAAATVTVGCRGHGCPFSIRRGATSCTGHRCDRSTKNGRTVNLEPLLARRRLAPGVVLTVSVTAPGTIGRSFSFRIRAGKPVVPRIGCLAPGSLDRGQTCPAVAVMSANRDLAVKDAKGD